MTQVYQTDEFGLSTLSVGSVTQPFGYTGEQRDDYAKRVRSPAGHFALGQNGRSGAGLSCPLV